GFVRGKQHFLERLNNERLPVHSGLELAKSYSQLGNFADARHFERIVGHGLPRIWVLVRHPAAYAAGSPKARRHRQHSTSRRLSLPTIQQSFAFADPRTGGDPITV